MHEASPPQDSSATFSPIIGASVPRMDGAWKTTGVAKYTADHKLPGMLYAVPVCSTIARGRLASMDIAIAERMRGVIQVLHHGNIGPLFRVATDDVDTRISEARPPFEDETIYYWGQYIAVVVARTLEQAQAAATALNVHYETQEPLLSALLDDHDGAVPIESSRGNSEIAFSQAEVQLDTTYATPTETHNPMEMHATLAAWEGDKVTLYESTQGVMTHLLAISQVLGLPKENVRVISRFIGSGFGDKLAPWPHSALAAAAARKLKRPVKLMLSRKMMFCSVGHRPRTQQRMRLGATRGGKLVSLQQDYRSEASLIDDYKEGCGEATPLLYSVANLKVTSALVRRSIGTPCPMRGPGAAPGIFALESAIDELAVKLDMDPVQLRLLNDTLIDESKDKPFTSRHLRECFETGAARFGWSQRSAKTGSMRKGDLILGWGTAAACWQANRSPCQVDVLLLDDGSAKASCATQDIGTGTYTIFAQVVNEKTGIPLERIEVTLGDTSLSFGPRSGGSRVTATVLPAVAAASEAAVRSLLSLTTDTPRSPYHGSDPASLRMTLGRVHRKDQRPQEGAPFQDILRLARVRYAIGQGSTGGLGSDTEAANFSAHSFGAQFVEVEWDPRIASVRVSRVVSVIDGGRIINRKMATNQIIGAVMMGIGMGLLERTVYDPRTGHPVNDNYADYLVPTMADTPEIDVVFLDHPDPLMGEYGARGIGEIGIAGVAPAITAAVYHATGIRVRELPVRIEDLLASQAGQ